RLFLVRMGLAKLEIALRPAHDALGELQHIPMEAQDFLLLSFQLLTLLLGSLWVLGRSALGVPDQLFEPSDLPDELLQFLVQVIALPPARDRREPGEADHHP